MATDYETLIPSGIADEAIAAAEQESVVLALGNVIRMGAGVESIPVVSIAPSVGFVSPAYGGRKPITQVEWSAERLEPVDRSLRQTRTGTVRIPGRDSRQP